MGYWAKDGSYQYDESDIELREAMNETQGQRYDRLHSHDGAPKKTWYEQHQEEARREAEEMRRVEERAKIYSDLRAYREQEEQKKEEQQKRELQKQAYEAAKHRFNSLSSVKKLWLKLSGKGINSYSPYNKVETLDSLYRGRSR